MLEQDAIKKWMESEPALAGKDLRPYFFACTEQEDFFFSTQDERLRELILAVRNGKFTTGSRTEWIKQLENDDALYIFKKITAEIFKCNLKDQKAPKIIEGIRVFVLNRPELQSALADFLLTLPGDKLGVWATGGWDDCIPKTAEARATLNDYFKKIYDQTRNCWILEIAMQKRALGKILHWLSSAFFQWGWQPALKCLTNIERK